MTSATEHMGSVVYVLRTLDPWAGALDSAAGRVLGQELNWE